MVIVQFSVEHALQYEESMHRFETEFFFKNLELTVVGSTVSRLQNDFF